MDFLTNSEIVFKLYQHGRRNQLKILQRPPSKISACRFVRSIDSYYILKDYLAIKKKACRLQFSWFSRLIVYMIDVLNLIVQHIANGFTFYLLLFLSFHSIFYSQYILYYLAQKLCFWTGIIFICVYVSVCVCVSVCV